MRVAEGGEQDTHRLQAQLDPELFEGEEPIDGRHRGAPD